MIGVNIFGGEVLLELATDIELGGECWRESLSDAGFGAAVGMLVGRKALSIPMLVRSRPCRIGTVSNSAHVQESFMPLCVSVSPTKGW